MNHFIRDLIWVSIVSFVLVGIVMIAYDQHKKSHIIKIEVTGVRGK